MANQRLRINREDYTLVVFRVVEIKGEKILKPVAPDEEVHIKSDDALNVFVTGFIPTVSLKTFDMDEEYA